MYVACCMWSWVHTETWMWGINKGIRNLHQYQPCSWEKVSHWNQSSAFWVEGSWLPQTGVAKRHLKNSPVLNLLSSAYLLLLLPPSWNLLCLISTYLMPFSRHTVASSFSSSIVHYHFLHVAWQIINNLALCFVRYSTSWLYMVNWNWIERQLNYLWYFLEKSTNLLGEISKCQK